MKPRKRFGQHFLHDPGVLRKIVDAIAPAPGDRMVEIGPGEGVLTRLLLQVLPRLSAVEIDRDLAARLRTEFTDRLDLHEGDVLEFDFSVLGPGLRVVGNLPYNISTPILFHLASQAGALRDLHFMLQLEVVQRMVARPDTAEYGRLSVMLQTRFRMEKLFHVPSGAFRPPPKVESAVVRLVPLPAPPDCDPEALSRVVREAFSARRKTLRNAIGLPAAELEALGYDPQLRPENLAPADFVAIARRVSERAMEPGE